MLMMSKRYLVMEHANYRGTGGTSVENREFGFLPAFRDTRSGRVYRSEYADGRPAPFHSLEGLPDELVVARDRLGRPTQVLGTVIAGFLRDGRFYTRDEALAEVEQLRSVCH